MYISNLKYEYENQLNLLKHYSIFYHEMVNKLKAIKKVSKKDGKDYVNLKKNFTGVKDITIVHHDFNGNISHINIDIGYEPINGKWEKFELDWYITYTSDIKMNKNISLAENIMNFIKYEIKIMEYREKNYIDQLNKQEFYFNKMLDIYNQLYELLENNDPVLHDKENKNYNTSLYYSLIDAFIKGL